MTTIDMDLLDLTYPTPAENLACDEALLDWVDTHAESCGGTEGVLRFYESPELFVVVGYGNKVESEVNVSACADAGVPVLRRVSGGGTVVLGPGCLAYAIALPTHVALELESVTGTNRWIMERQRRAMQAVTAREVRVQGHTDLTVDGLKFSGNSQRRRARSVLFHGTLLLSFDLSVISRCLRFPSMEPDYRAGRAHAAFVTNLALAGATVKSALAAEWGAERPFRGTLEDRVRNLVNERYERSDWNNRR
ncbi:MAG: lipoate--protein ligase family protein [Verrucomicrobiales bacterium]|nr:lipoate--protein ligase family protein [Verrucomicrobiales bacterium]